MVENTKVNDPQTAGLIMETLREFFKPHLKLPKARLTCFLMLVLAIFGQRTVSLVRLARHATSPAKAESVSGVRGSAHREWLEARAAKDDGKIDPTAQDALRRGWYLGDETFRDHLLDLVDKAKGVKARKRSRCECVRQDHGEKEAECLIRQCAPHLGLPTGTAELALLRRRTTVGFEWIGIRLQMGHTGSVSRLACHMKRDRKLEKSVNELENLS